MFWMCREPSSATALFVKISNLCDITGTMGNSERSGKECDFTDWESSKVWIAEGDRQQILCFRSWCVRWSSNLFMNSASYLLLTNSHSRSKITNTLQYIMKNRISGRNAPVSYYISMLVVSYTTGTRAAREGFDWLLRNCLTMRIPKTPEFTSKHSRACEKAWWGGWFQLAPYAQFCRGTCRFRGGARIEVTTLPVVLGPIWAIVLVIVGSMAFGANVPDSCHRAFPALAGWPYDDVYQGCSTNVNGWKR